MNHSTDFTYKLPPELALHIFSFLGHYELCNAGLVSQTWLQFVRSPPLWSQLKRVTAILALDRILSLPQFDNVLSIQLDELTPEGLQFLVRRCPKLEKVELREMHHMARGILKTLLQGLPRLSFLSLFYLPESDTQFAQIALEGPFPRLESLKLFSCDDLGETSVQAISVAFPALRRLNLCRQPGITISALQPLSRLTSLSRLELLGTEVQPQELDDFKQRGLPRHCQVVHHLSLKLDISSILSSMDAAATAFVSNSTGILNSPDIDSAAATLRHHYTSLTRSMRGFFKYYKLSRSDVTNEMLLHLELLPKLSHVTEIHRDLPSQLMRHVGINDVIKPCFEAISRVFIVGSTQFTLYESDASIGRTLLLFLEFRGCPRVRYNGIAAVHNITRSDAGRRYFLDIGLLPRLETLFLPGTPDGACLRLLRHLASIMYSYMATMAYNPSLVSVMRRLVDIPDAYVAYSVVQSMTVLLREESVPVDVELIRNMCSRWLQPMQADSLFDRPPIIPICFGNMLNCLHTRGEREKQILGENPYEALIAHYRTFLSTVEDEENE